MSKNNRGNSKNGCITYKRTPERPEEMLKAIFVYIAMQPFTQKRLCEMNARECDTKEDFNQNGCR